MARVGTPFRDDDVAAATLAISIPAGARKFNIFSAVDAHFYDTAAGALKAFTVATGASITGFDVSNRVTALTGATNAITIAALTGNLGEVSYFFED